MVNTKMVNYKNGKIYKIVCDVSDFIYIGSTCQPLNKRWGEHKTETKTNCKSQIYEYMRKMGIEHFLMILIKYVSC